MTDGNNDGQKIVSDNSSYKHKGSVTSTNPLLLMLILSPTYHITLLLSSTIITYYHYYRINATRTRETVTQFTTRT